MNTGDLVKNLLELIENKDEESARLLLQNRDTSAISDSSFHLGLARIAEELGDVSTAVTEYNYAIRDDKANKEAVLGLARLRADMGQAERAARAYRKFLEMDPHNEEVKGELTALLAGAGPFQGDSNDMPEVSIEPTDADLVTFAELFKAREGVYARQWVSPTGKSGYTPVHEPFTPHVAGKHLMGAITVGIYTIRHDQKVTFLAFDVDISKRSLERAGRQPGSLAAMIRNTHKAAGRLLDELARIGLQGYIEDSGHKGRHVWVFFKSPLPAKPVRKLGLALVERAGLNSDEQIAVEVFPRQTRVNKDGLGNLIKLPLGIHRQTSRRCLFLHPDGTAVQDPLAMLRGAARADADRVSRALSMLFPGGTGPNLDDKVRYMDEQDEEGTDSDPGSDYYGETFVNMATRGDDAGHGGEDRQSRWAGTIAKAEYDPEQDLEFMWLLDHCEPLSAIIRKAEETGTITNDERLVLTYTIGHLEKGPKAVNHFLDKVMDMDPSLFLKSRLKGNPMSCAKIRSKTRHLKVDCRCRFENSTGLYPTPLLHLKDLAHGPGSAKAYQKSLKITQLKVERMVDELFKARAEAQRAEQRALEIEGFILGIMEEQEVQELQTSSCTLTIDKEAKGLLIKFGTTGKSLPRTTEAGEKAGCKGTIDSTEPKLKVVPSDEE